MKKGRHLLNKYLRYKGAVIKPIDSLWSQTYTCEVIKGHIYLPLGGRAVKGDLITMEREELLDLQNVSALGPRRVLL